MMWNSNVMIIIIMNDNEYEMMTMIINEEYEMNNNEMN